MDFLTKFKGKRGKPKFISENYWEIKFLYPPQIHIVFSFTNSPDGTFSTCKISVWDFYGKAIGQTALLGEFLLDEKFPVINSVEDGQVVFDDCSAKNYKYIKQQIEEIISSARGLVKWKWSRKEKKWYRHYLVNKKVVKKERVDRNR